jgi:ATP-binding cassette, subfamily B, bacterial
LTIISKFKFPNYRQFSYNDCGPACLKIISRFYGKDYSIDSLREHVGVNRDGATMFALSKGAEAIGFKTLAIETDAEKLEEMPLPCIVYWKPSHYIVLYEINKKFVRASDPGFGLIKLTRKEFEERWIEKDNKGKALLFETSADFYKMDSSEKKDKIGLKFLLKYFYLYKQLIIQLIIGLIVSTVFALIFPYLTQSLVDVGINQKNLNFVYLILIAQIVLFVSQSAIGFIRSWIFLHISTKMNISLVSDFLYKLMKLPILFVESRSFGDIYQRIFDLNRLQTFISSTTLNFIYSFITLILFSFVLISYSMQIFLIFVIGSILGIAWILLFLNKRKELDYKKFYESTSSQNTMVQILTGIREIKLSGAEMQKCAEWEKVQSKIFKLSIKSLYWSQIQQYGSLFINQLKNIIISIIAATQVINGDITLGMMMAVIYIIGQINAPIEQLIGIIQVFQDAKISLARISEVYNNEEEEKPGVNYVKILESDKTIYFKNVCFKYFKNDLNYIIKNLNLEIPQNKVTAIVGASGSGKTTLIKLLLKFYDVNEGEIIIGKENIKDVSAFEWRRLCGSVMQDGYFFYDTIKNNITLGSEVLNEERLKYAINVSNLNEFIDSLPKGYETKIGMMGEGISQGQRQRILIARALYKNSDFVFFDEATSDLDSENESQIIGNLLEFYKEKTILLIAHRLSTVKNADNIYVLDNGTVVEEGKHLDLINRKGNYYRLFKSQF